MDQEIITKAQLLRKTIPVSYKEAFELAKQNLSQEEMVQRWKQEKAELFSEKFGASPETATELLEQYNYDFSKAFRVYERSLYSGIDYILLKAKTDEDVHRMVRYHMSQKYVFKGDIWDITASDEWPEMITACEKNFIIMQQWLDYIEYEGLSYAETSLTPLMLYLLERELHLPEHAVILRALDEIEDLYRDYKRRRFTGKSSFYRWRRLREKRNKHPGYKQLNKKFEAILPALEAAMVQYIRVNKDQFA